MSKSTVKVLDKAEKKAYNMQHKEFRKIRKSKKTWWIAKGE